MRRSILALIATMAFAGCGDAVVDGACADGYEVCDGRCLPAGTCSTQADATVDTGVLDATPDGDDANGEDGAPLDAFEADVDDGWWALDLPDDEVDADAATDSMADAKSDGNVDALDADACPPPPYTSNAHCGACGKACSGATPSCKPSPDPSVWECRPVCDPPTTWCSGKCVELDVDPLNCGACGKTCPTGLCNGGKCRGAKAGHVVVIGHDYVGASSLLAVAKVVQNAVFLPSKNPVRVLAWEQWADAAAISSVKTILDAEAASSGRSYSKTVSLTTADFRDKMLIDNYEVAFVFDAPKAPAGGLALAASDLKLRFDSFAKSGGVVVVLNGGGGIAEMPQFLTSSGLLATTGQTNVTGKAVEVVAPGDAVGIGVLSPYLAPTRSVSFDTTDTATTVVQEPSSKKPVVLHRVVVKP